MDYFKELKEVFSGIEVWDKEGRALSFDRTIQEIVDLIIAKNKKGNKIILIGNGGSASITSHIATDFLKNASIRAITFNDASLLTCISNDLGYEYVFQKPVEILAKKRDILFAISSSGKSKNILNAVLKTSQIGCLVITFSGFAKENPLRNMGEVNFYVPSSSYGYVEIVHLAICHRIVDDLMKKNSHG